MARPSRYGPGTGSTGLTPASTWTGRMPASASAPLSSPPQRASAPTAPPVGVAPVYATQAQTSQSPANPSDAQDQADMQAQIQAQYQAWYQQEAQAQYQAQYQAQVEAQMQAAPQLRQQPPIRVQAPQAPEPALAASADGYQQRADAPTSPPAMPQTQTPAPLAADPMAPRRDARIFQMQRPPDASSTAPASNDAARTQAPTPAPNQVQPQAQPYNGQAYASAGPPREGARYYSVHRAEGRQPDPITMPESVYAPMDLAEPPAQPVQTRNVNGRLQAVVPNADPSLP